MYLLTERRQNVFNVLVLNPLTMSYDVVKGNLPIIQAAELKKTTPG